MRRVYDGCHHGRLCSPVIVLKCMFMQKVVVVMPLTILFTIMVISCSKDNEAALGNGTCDTLNMSFATNIQPLFNTYCTSCHNPSTFSGGQDLTTYAGVVNATDNGKLLGVINHAPGFQKMPQGAAKLSDCNISKITAWINQGMLNN